MPTLKRSVARTQDIQDRMNGKKKELVEREAIIHGRAESNPLANRK
jgi:hypothetical protein